jgi:WD40 repeat protein
MCAENELHTQRSRGPKLPTSHDCMILYCVPELPTAALLIAYRTDAKLKEHIRSRSSPAMQKFATAPTLAFNAEPEAAALCALPGAHSFGYPTDDPAIRRVAFSPDGSRVFAWHSSNEVFVYDLPPTAFAYASATVTLGPALCNNPQPDVVNDATWYPCSQATPSPSLLCVACKQQPVRLLEATTGHTRASYVWRSNTDDLALCLSLAWSADGARLLVGGNARVAIFDVCRPGVPNAVLCSATRSGSCSQRGLISALAAAQTGRSFACGSFDGSVCQYDERTRGAVACMEYQDVRCSASFARSSQRLRELRPGGVTQLLYSGNLLFCGFRQSSEIVCWDVRNGTRPVGSCFRDCHGSQRFFFDIDATGSTLLTGDATGSLRVYDTRSCDELFLMEGFPDAVGSVSCHPGVDVANNAFCTSSFACVQRIFSF